LSRWLPKLTMKDVALNCRPLRFAKHEEEIVVMEGSGLIG